jgi:butyrate kinase
MLPGFRERTGGLETIRYQCEDLPPYASLREQWHLGKRGSRFSEKECTRSGSGRLFISRGGLGNPAPAGVYRIDESCARTCWKEDTEIIGSWDGEGSEISKRYGKRPLSSIREYR